MLFTAAVGVNIVYISQEGSLNIVRSVATSKAGACDPWEKGVCAGSRAQLRVKVSIFFVSWCLPSPSMASV